MQIFDGQILERKAKEGGGWPAGLLFGDHKTLRACLKADDFTLSLWAERHAFPVMEIPNAEIKKLKGAMGDEACLLIGMMPHLNRSRWSLGLDCAGVH
ncbi:hypothetical protein HOP50_01g02750 [Chloropicon primus]|uniref:Uncharacterized protein n=1 Tax=Chloropicon primus TaxID=1764295 RepID=A0A5B8MBM5_9CHLO|nr:hypothetical protein A3770_01p02850 [Chloropicon primus]UPQ96984.1 hypothetical protein HOP50_01g02750 [Chloropicon primus]|eukprot:QDZ17767.1 hypothetical protein A3770_01p02850 [Chloropicon primus]